MRRPQSGKIASRIARASTALLVAHRSTSGWSQTAATAVRHLLRARQTALFMEVGDERQVYGDARTGALVRQLATQRMELGGDAPVARIGRTSVVAPVADVAPPSHALGEHADDDGPFDLVYLFIPFAHVRGSLGVCCTFAPAVSERVARSRLSLLQAVSPVLEATACVRLGQAERRQGLDRLLAALDVGAALLARDGTVLQVNRALGRLLAVDGGDALREDIARAATSLPGRASAGRGGLRTRSRCQRYQVQVREIAPASTLGAPAIIALVDAATPDTASVVPDCSELLSEQYQLTGRERDVARLLHLGHSNAAIAQALGISPNTARHYTERVLSKLGIRSRAAIHGVLFDVRQQQAPTAVPDDRRDSSTWSATGQPTPSGARAAS